MVHFTSLIVTLLVGHASFCHHHTATAAVTTDASFHENEGTSNLRSRSLSYRERKTKKKEGLDKGGVLDGGTAEPDIMMPLPSSDFDVFLSEHGFEDDDSTVDVYVVDSTNNSILLNDKIYSLDKGLEEQEMSKMSLADAGVQKFIGQQYDNDSITVTKDMGGNIQSVDLMTSNDNGEPVKFHLVAFNNKVMVKLNPEKSNDTIDKKNGMEIQWRSNQVRLCRHWSCGGGSVYVGTGWWRSMPWQIGNDELTRANIPTGYYFVYYEHGNFGGFSGWFGSRNHPIDLSMGGHNDLVSSFKVGRWG
jgi:hypothetical protein